MDNCLGPGAIRATYKAMEKNISELDKKRAATILDTPVFVSKYFTESDILLNAKMEGAIYIAPEAPDDRYNDYYNYFLTGVNVSAVSIEAMKKLLDIDGANAVLVDKPTIYTNAPGVYKYILLKIIYKDESNSIRCMAKFFNTVETIYEILTGK